MGMMTAPTAHTLLVFFFVMWLGWECIHNVHTGTYGVRMVLRLVFVGVGVGGVGWWLWTVIFGGRCVQLLEVMDDRSGICKGA